ncbi:hypothetical protein [Altericista sp. CCNU0014]|uniref:hypothetical protein n=1 Tax=Altericista sp. CCNU0014 TaxID=3082949 RepID=UPI00384A64C4
MSTRFEFPTVNGIQQRSSNIKSVIYVTAKIAKAIALGKPLKQSERAINGDRHLTQPQCRHPMGGFRQ